jgi:hypothetical protein
MKTRTAIGFLAAFTAGMALVPMSAKAVCQKEIYADRGFSNGTATEILGRVSTGEDPTAFSFVYMAATTSPVFANQIFAATANHNRVAVIGDVGACPTTGAIRNLGTIIQLYINP